MPWTKMIKVGIGEEGVNKGTFHRLLIKLGLKITTLSTSRELGWKGEGQTSD